MVADFGSHVRSRGGSYWTANWDTSPASYTDVPRTLQAKAEDKRVAKICLWLNSLARPLDISDSDYTLFIRFVMKFFLRNGKLWRKDPYGHHWLVATPASQYTILVAAHDDVAHKGFYTTNTLISKQFWWPAMHANIAWFGCTCRLCQLRQTRNVLIPPVVSNPAPLFTKVYIDTMHLPKSNGHKYIVQGHCSLSHYIEFQQLHIEMAVTLREWIFEDILCRWGAISEIITDNGPQFLHFTVPHTFPWTPHGLCIACSKVMIIPSKSCGVLVESPWNPHEVLIICDSGLYTYQ